MAAKTAAGGALPPDSGNLVGWWDGSDTSSITATGSNVDSLADKIGSADLASSGSNRPTTGATVNGLNALLFAKASQQRLVGPASLTAVANFAVYCVVEIDDASPYAVVPFHIGGPSDGYGWTISSATNNRSGYLAGALAWQNCNGVGVLTSGVRLLGLCRAASAWEFRLDGVVHDVSQYGGNPNTPTATRIGSHDNGGGYFNGKFCEGLVYDSDHSTTTSEEVEAYLADKWGVTI